MSGSDEHAGRQQASSGRELIHNSSASTRKSSPVTVSLGNSMRVPGLTMWAGFCVAALFATSALAAVDEAPKTLDLEQRIACQTVIEDLAWSKRIWPAENPTPKPPRSQVLSDAAIRAKVESSLRMENALAEHYGQRLDAKALQIELNRMARNSRAPDVLEERFAALGNDPLRVAECLAKPELVKRRLHDAYESDAKQHAATRERAEAALLSGLEGDHLSASGGIELLVVYALDADNAKQRFETDPPNADLDSNLIWLDAEAFAHMQNLLRQQDSAAKSRLGRTAPDSGLREAAKGFYVDRIVSDTEKRIEIRRHFWTKQDFNAWWAERANDWPASPAKAALTGIELPTITGSRHASTQAAADSWYNASAPVARVGHTAVWTGSEMIIWGGSDGSHDSLDNDSSISSGGRYDPASDTWSATPPLTFQFAARIDHSAVWTGSEMIVWGGSEMAMIIHPFADGARFDPLSETWTPTQTLGAPEGRVRHEAFWTGSEMIIWGGAFDPSPGGRYDPVSDSWTLIEATGAPDTNGIATLMDNELFVWNGGISPAHRYDLAGDTWSLTSAPPVEHTARKAIWTGDEVIVTGHQGGAGTVSAIRYDPIQNSWQTSTSVGPAALGIAYTAVWSGSELIIWGGSSVSGRYEPGSDSWSTMPAHGSSEVIGHTAIWAGNEMIVWGGSGSESSELRVLDTGARFSPSTNTWTEIDQSGGPNVRSPHAAVWTGNEMIVWGASDVASSTFNLPTLGGRYDPASDTWLPTTNTGAPSRRYRHSAVWTGSEMIVWGGSENPLSGNSPGMNTGGRYNPATNSWVPTSTEAAPQQRHWHSAVWTGSEMIIWGGSDSGTHLDSGGHYNPTSNSWTATPLTDSPSGRFRHATVWTGSEMIVWGGCAIPNCTSLLADGGRYDPSAKSWTAMQTVGAPTPRFAHTMVWSGDEAIVWGGYTGSDYLDTGGRYDPVNNLWSETQSSGAPAARSTHSAVWTGTEMIIWGGNPTAGSAGASGGRYDPSDDSWQAVSTLNAPQGMARHTAVWTGSEMLVWGRDSGLIILGAYYPSETYRIAGTLSGLAGTGLVLQNNGGNALSLSDNGSFEFSGMLASGNTYDVSVAVQPSSPPQQCTVSNGSGTVGNTDITDVQVTCVTNTYTVSPSASAGGSIDPAVAQLVEHGQSAVFVLTPDATHFLDSVGGSCGGSLQGSSYTTQAVIADCSVDALFEAHTSDTTLQGSTLLRLAQPEIFSVSVAGNHAAPADGQVVISASTGESCLDSGPPSIEGLQAGFSCELSFATPGPRSLVASFSGSASHPDSSSDPLSLAVVRMADLQVVIADGQLQTAPGAAVGYLIQLRNLGPDDAPGTTLLAASNPLLQSPSWTCTPVGAAVCPSSTGTGEVQILTDLPANSGLDFVQLANAPDPLIGSLLVAVEVEADSDAPNYVLDSNQANNQASDENLSTHLFKSGFE